MGGVKGVTRFVQLSENRCLIDGTIDGLSPGRHGLAVCESGDLSDGCARYELPLHHYPMMFTNFRRDRWNSQYMEPNCVFSCCTLASVGNHYNPSRTDHGGPGSPSGACRTNPMNDFDIFLFSWKKNVWFFQFDLLTARWWLGKHRSRLCG